MQIESEQFKASNLQYTKEITKINADDHLVENLFLVGPRGGARGVPGGATAPPKFCLSLPVAPPKLGLFLKVLHRPSTAPLVAKLDPPVAPPNENVWLRPWLGLHTFHSISRKYIHECNSVRMSSFGLVAKFHILAHWHS